tara:strand:- start:791 stop:2029 length:1239 start_codon:yes stop_codon:yes gene_type:complete
MTIVFNNYRQIDLRYWSLLLLAFFPVLPYALISIITALFLFICIYSFFGQEKRLRPNKEQLKEFILLAGFYLIICFSVFYSQETGTALKVVGRMVPLLLFPLVIIFFSRNYRLNNRKKKKILNAFVFSSFLLLIYVFILGFMSINDLHSHSIRNKLLETSYLDLHSTYISIYFSSAIFILIIAYNTKKNYWNLFLILLFLIGLLLIFSRGVVFSIIIEFVLFYLIRNKRKLWQKILVLLVFIFSMSLTIYQIPFLKYRITEIYQYGFQSTENNKRLSSTSMRLAVYSCTMDIIAKNPLTGLGVGDLQTELQLCYQSLNSPDFSVKNLNTHNFYFYMLGVTGILGLVGFMVSLIKILQKARKSENLLSLYIFSLVILILFTENILSRSYGLTFYCFFLAILYFSKGKIKRISN